MSMDLIIFKVNSLFHLEHCGFLAESKKKKGKSTHEVKPIVQQTEATEHRLIHTLEIQAPPICTISSYPL